MGATHAAFFVDLRFCFACFAGEGNVFNEISPPLTKEARAIRPEVETGVRSTYGSSSEAANV